MIRRRFLALATLLPLAFPAGLLAAAALPSPTPAPPSVASINVFTHLNNLKINGAAEMDRRRGNLQDALDKINVSSTLSSDLKTKVTKRLKTELDTLVALETKLGGETDLPTGRKDVQQLINEYPTYSLLLVQARVIVATDREEVTGNQLVIMTALMQSKVNAATLKKDEVGAATIAINDLKAKVKDYKAKTGTIIPTVLALSFTNYTTAYQAMLVDRNNLYAARADFKAANTDITQLIVLVNELKLATPSPTPIPSVTPKPSATPVPVKK